MFKQKVLKTPIKDFQLGNNLDGYRRDKPLTKEDIKVIIQDKPIQFIIADVGHELEIISSDQCFNFWKYEVKKHLADASKRNRLEDYPDEYLYFASKWIAEDSSPIILLEKQH
ncbi:hypothetical protein [Hymenobacter sp. BRD67]|uniref:hypothetical protein n=1 Tax=Hymenobacter sp. BRD67 TaxID=2675877 RepID=UPI0015654B11|nr:hypothetical protein [Hymenobacter sp. BRD67]QKG52366.1 hypothetical protein GKZ67_06760 [Hymenobacter sp. BRD67]